MSEEIKKTARWHMLFPLSAVVFLLVVSIYYLQMRNGDVLFMAQMYSIFISGTEFFRECMSRPGGLLEWGGRWFTQLFYVPWLGSMVLALLWTCIFFVLKKAYSVANGLSPLLLVPVIALLVSDIDLGYWLYYLKQPGYYFRETLGILSVALFIWASRLDRLSLVGSLLAAAAYPLIGFYSPPCTTLHTHRGYHHPSLDSRRHRSSRSGAVTIIVQQTVYHAAHRRGVHRRISPL